MAAARRRLERERRWIDGLGLVIGLLALGGMAEAAFVNGIERFDGTVKDTSTWTEVGTGSATQDDALTLSNGKYYSTNFTVGIGDVVGVDVLAMSGPAGWFRLYLSETQDVVSGKWLAIDLRPSGGAPGSICGWQGSGSQGTGINNCFGTAMPAPTARTPQRLEIERVSSSTIVFRAPPIGQVSQPSPIWPIGPIADHLHITLWAPLNQTVVVDDVTWPDRFVCGDGTLDPNEECDDGNVDDGDCCSSRCRWDTENLGCTGEVEVEPGENVLELFGGSRVPGGVDVYLDALTGGTLEALSSSASDPADIRAIWGAFNFLVPTVPAQAWFFDFDGTLDGPVTLVFGYDDARLVRGLTEPQLRMYHRTNGSWNLADPVEPPPNGVDTTANTITVTVDGFSGFALGGPPAADQAIAGSALIVKDPTGGVDPAKRLVKVTAKQQGGDNAVVGSPADFGVVLEVYADGATPTVQAFELPQGLRSNGLPFWKASGTKFTYADPKGENGTSVKKASISQSSNGTFAMKAVVKGDNGPIDIVPPNPGTGGWAVFKIPFGDRYCAKFGPDAVVKNTDDRLFKVTKPESVGCPTTSTSTTTTTSTSTTVP